MVEKSCQSPAFGGVRSGSHHTPVWSLVEQLSFDALSLLYGLAPLEPCNHLLLKCCGQWQPGTKGLPWLIPSARLWIMNRSHRKARTGQVSPNVNKLNRENLFLLPHACLLSLTPASSSSFLHKTSVMSRISYTFSPLFAPWWYVSAWYIFPFSRLTCKPLEPCNWQTIHCPSKSCLSATSSLNVP